MQALQHHRDRQASDPAFVNRYCEPLKEISPWPGSSDALDPAPRSPPPRCPASRPRCRAGGPRTPRRSGRNGCRPGTKPSLRPYCSGHALAVRRVYAPSGARNSGINRSIGRAAGSQPERQSSITSEDRHSSAHRSTTLSCARRVRRTLRDRAPVARCGPARAKPERWGGAEALDMLTALITGHEGSLRTAPASRSGVRVKRPSVGVLEGVS